MTTGSNWVVDYQWLGESDFPGVESMMIYGAADSEIALDEARYSLDAGKTPYVIIGLTMVGDQAARSGRPRSDAG
jgi:hypothetical protein